MITKALEHLLGLHSHIRPAISPPCSHNATPARRQCHPPGDKAITNLILNYQKSPFPVIFCSPHDISPSQLILFFPVPLHISRVRTYCGVPQPHSHACSYLQVERSVLQWCASSIDIIHWPLIYLDFSGNFSAFFSPSGISRTLSAWPIGLALLLCLGASFCSVIFQVCSSLIKQSEKQTSQ